jgi:hypothetical protein
MSNKSSFLFIVVIVFFSCSKDKKITNGNYWILDANRYDIVSTKQNVLNNYFVLSGLDDASPADTIKLYFQSKPSRSIKYTVIQF